MEFREAKEAERVLSMLFHLTIVRVSAKQSERQEVGGQEGQG